MLQRRQRRPWTVVISGRALISETRSKHQLVFWDSGVVDRDLEGCRAFPGQKRAPSTVMDRFASGDKGTRIVTSIGDGNGAMMKFVVVHVEEHIKKGLEDLALQSRSDYHVAKLLSLFLRTEPLSAGQSH
uniref:Transposase n=1 Tax=Steinernema glaseri TaxID=37863 RepID=A0A1I7ZYY5_9BILA